MKNRFQFLIIVIFFYVGFPTFVLGHETVVDGIKFDINEEDQTAELITIINKQIVDINIPDKISINDIVYTVNSIGFNGFGGCFSLKSISLPNTIVEIKQNAFYGCKALSTVNLPNSLKIIGIGAFANCTNIKTIIIPNSVEVIERWAFCSCEGLETVVLPNSLSVLNYRLFAYCYNLKSISIPESVTTIGEEVFLYCKNITSIIIPSAVKQIKYRAFCGCTGIKSIIIPKSVTSIEAEVFLSCENLQSISLPDSLTSLESSVFSGCSNLESIDIPKNVKKINSSAFFDCVKLKKIDIPDSVESIGSYAFSGCSNLSSVIIPKSVKEIKNEAFGNCRKLLEVYCYADSLPIINSNAFFESYMEYSILYVQSHLITKYQTTPTWNSFGTYKTFEGSVVTLSQCSKPVISYFDSQLQYDCDTDNTKYYHTIKSSDSTKDFLLAQDNTVNLNAYYDITCYATAYGYKDSDVATAKLYWLPSSGTLEGDNINNVAMRGIAIQSAGGFINISGLDNNEKVDFYGVDGKVLGSAKSIDGSVSFSAKQGTVVIAKIGKESVKIAVE